MLPPILSKWLRGPPSPKPNPLLAPAFKQSICQYFSARDNAAISRALTDYLPAEVAVTVAFEKGAVRYPMNCVWSVTRPGASHFIFPLLLPGQLLEVVVERWLALMDLFSSIARSTRGDDSIAVNLGDLGFEPGLAFSGNSPEHILIPDSYFMRSRGYQAERDYFARHQPRWKKRSPRVFWRGSSLGRKHHPILEMPRARLCLLAQAKGEDWGDIGMAAFIHIPDADAEVLQRRQLIKEHVPWNELSNYRYHIDIDGHASSFAGLFRKLLSGGLVLKVDSPEGCRQWYYDRLTAGENFVPVRSDLSDLVEIVSYYRKHARAAESIARRGRQLALSLSYEKEFAFAAQEAARAFAARGEESLIL